MKLLIKQRVFSWTDTYDVYDENGCAKYYVRSEFFSIGHKIHVYNTLTNLEVGSISERVLTFLPEFKVYINGNNIGSIRKQLTLFRPKYHINYNNWHVTGNILGWDYDVVDNRNHTIMHISKELLHFGDTYVLDFMNPENEIMGLLLVIAIDAANCSKDN
ncbi:MAG TPA: hypothetical protein DG753_03770 [Clostridium sp.]|nr:hypothetical protein [Clostridium sp.]